MRRRGYLLFAMVVGLGLLARVALAQEVPYSLIGAAASFEGSDKLQVWANSPRAAIAIDNHTGGRFYTLNVQWQNLIKGSFLVTPEGVVVGSERQGDALTSALTVQPGDRQGWALHPNINGPYRFAVIGSTQGPDSQGIYGILAKQMAARQVKFAIHLGDAVTHGDARQMAIFREQLKSFPFPTYVLPGTDDLAYGGQAAWEQLFGKLPLAFSVGGDTFLMLEDAAGGVPKREKTWLLQTLQRAQDAHARHLFVFLHRPIIDPRPGFNSGISDVLQARWLLAVFKRFHVNTVFAGHLPLFNQERRKDVYYVISGGGGAKLAVAPSRGGFHHYVEISVNGDAVSVVPEHLQ
jgi:hypothetical protein